MVSGIRWLPLFYRAEHYHRAEVLNSYPRYWFLPWLSDELWHDADTRRQHYRGWRLQDGSDLKNSSSRSGSHDRPSHQWPSLAQCQN